MTPTRSSAHTLCIPSPSPPINNRQFAEPRPDHLRAFVFDYLCHNCYTETARAFAKDTAVRHLNKDGDEIMSRDTKWQGAPSAELTEECLRKIRLREEIRTEILSGRIDEATSLLNEHFPSVLLTSNAPSSEPPSLPDSHSDRIDFAFRTVLDPTLLSLNLRIHAFIEACRTVPLPYIPPHQGTHVETITPPTNIIPNPMTNECYQTELLLRGQKLYASMELLRDPEDQTTYSKELENVCGLLAYPVPEHSPMSKYLDQARRESVAQQINRAILYHSNSPAISHLELAVRYNYCLWDELNKLQVKVPTNKPPGVSLPPEQGHKDMLSSEEKTPVECLPPFDLRSFLDAKA